MMSDESAAAIVASAAVSTVGDGVLSNAAIPPSTEDPIVRNGTAVDAVATAASTTIDETSPEMNQPTATTPEPAAAAAAAPARKTPLIPSKIPAKASRTPAVVTPSSNRRLPTNATQQLRPTITTSQQRLSELEELRQKGLATLLNKHFSDTITTLAKEKAEADAQLRDLEQRKAATSEFVESTKAGGKGNGQLSPFDSLYVQLKKKRNECRRKERETMMLYQRYVHKFGATGAVQVPSTARAPPVSAPPPDGYRQGVNNNSSTLVPSLAQAIDAKVTELKQQGVDPIPTRDRLGVDTTYQMLHERDAWELQQFYRRQLEERGIDARCCNIHVNHNLTYNSPNGLGPRKLFHGPRFPGGLPQLLESPGSPDSKPTVTPWQYGVPGQQHVTPPLYNTTIIGEDGEEREDAEEEAEDDDEEDHFNGDNNMADFSGFVVSGDNNEYPYDQYYMEDDGGYDDRSMVSGLTSVNSAATMLMHETENRLVQFLKTETEAIRKMLSEETTSVEDSNRSTKSGGAKSVKSTGSGAALASVASNSNDLHSSSSPAHGGASDLGSHSSHAADQAEHMVKQMQDILHQYLVKADDGVSPSAKAVPPASPPASSPYPRRLDGNVGKPNEIWMVYYDDIYQKEYYHEVNSKRSQWDMPETSSAAAASGASGSNTEAASECTSTSATTVNLNEYGQQQVSVHKAALSLSHEDVMPDHRHRQQQQQQPRLDDDRMMIMKQQQQQLPSSRRSLYLQKRRRLRQRNRRFIAILVATATVTGMTLVWKHHYHPHATWPDAVVQTFGEESMVSKFMNKYDNDMVHVMGSFQNVKKVTLNAILQLIGGNDDIKQSEPEQTEIISRSLDHVGDLDSGIDENKDDVLSENHVVDGNNATGSEIMDCSQSDDCDETLLVETVREEEEDENMSDTALAVLEDDDDKSLEVIVEKVRRPWLCNIPLAWLLHPRCWRLAHESPLYCAHSFVNEMMI